MKIALLLIVIVIFVFLLIVSQHRMIYYPHPYDGDPPLPERGRALQYNTGQGRQLAFYLPPRDKEHMIPSRLWLLFGGNGSLALDWLQLIGDFPEPDAGFLLVDYPGYGSSRGRASPATIMASAEAALQTLAAHLDTDPAELERRLRVMGHSLGGAVALLYAENHPVKRIVLISPFTSLKEMATSMVGPVLARTLLQNYDNRATLKKTLQRRPVVPITIIHGRRDRVVRVEMGRELAGISDKIKYLEVENGDHNYILITAREQIIRAMLGSAPTDRGERDGA